MVLIAMIMGQILAGVSVSSVKVVMLSGIALAALIFPVLMFYGVQEPA